MQTLGNTSMTEHQFCQLLGRMRLYPLLPQGYQKAIPRMLLTDTQINSVAKAYINDDNFGSLGSDLSMWKFYNLLTGSNKSSYIDSFLDRATTLQNWQRVLHPLCMVMKDTVGFFLSCIWNYTLLLVSQNWRLCYGIYSMCYWRLWYSSLQWHCFHL